MKLTNVRDSDTLCSLDVEETARPEIRNQRVAGWLLVAKLD